MLFLLMSEFSFSRRNILHCLILLESRTHKIDFRTRPSKAQAAMTSMTLRLKRNNATGYSRGQIGLMLAIPAVLDTWRLFGDDVPQWVPVVSVMSKGVGAAWIWTY